MRAVLLALLLAIACGGQDRAEPTSPKEPATAPARPSADRCLAAARALAAELSTSSVGVPAEALERLRCPELYRRESCATAWAGVSLAAPDQRVERVLGACAAAYCGDLPAGVRACASQRPADDRVDLVIELDRAVLLAEKYDPKTADALSRRAVLLREITVEVAPRADAAPPEPLAVRVTITAVGQTFLNGTLVADAHLPAALRTAAARSRSLTIAADDNVPYRRVLEVLELARAAGFQKLAIAVDSSASP